MPTRPRAHSCGAPLTHVDRVALIDSVSLEWRDGVGFVVTQEWSGNIIEHQYVCKKCGRRLAPAQEEWVEQHWPHDATGWELKKEETE